MVLFARAELTGAVHSGIVELCTFCVCVCCALARLGSSLRVRTPRASLRDSRGCIFDKQLLFAHAPLILRSFAHVCVCVCVAFADSSRSRSLRFFQRALNARS